MRKILSVVALLAFTSAHAQWIDKEGERLADKEDRKAIAALAQKSYLPRTRKSSRSGGVLPRRPQISIRSTMCESMNRSTHSLFSVGASRA
jgi:hypothetical protein